MINMPRKMGEDSLVFRTVSRSISGTKIIPWNKIAHSKYSINIYINQLTILTLTAEIYE